MAARLTAIACVILALSGPVWADDLTLSPGLVLTWNIRTNSDYTVTCQITEASALGYRVTYAFSPPVSIRGTQFVSADDMRSATWIKAQAANGDISQAGQVSFVRISDIMFTSLKAGRSTPFNLTGPRNPRSLQKIGEADLTVAVNGTPTQLHTLIGRSPDGGTFWVLDNPALPVVLQGDYAWKWTTPSIQTGIPSTTKTGSP